MDAVTHTQIALVNHISQSRVMRMVMQQKSICANPHSKALPVKIIYQFIQVMIQQGIGILTRNIKLLYPLVITTGQESLEVLPLTVVNSKLVVLREEFVNVFSQAKETLRIALAQEIDIRKGISIAVSVFSYVDSDTIDFKFFLHFPLLQ
jgi:hypothetical protein